MKILALHGLGSSASMLKGQFAPFIRDLGPSYLFTFLDGAIPRGKGPGMSLQDLLCICRELGLSEVGKRNRSSKLGLGTLLLVCYWLHHSRSAASTHPLGRLHQGKRTF